MEGTKKKGNTKEQKKGGTEKQKQKGLFLIHAPKVIWSME